MELYNKGVKLYKQAQYQLCITAFNQALEQEPSNKNIYIYRGMAFHKLLRHQEALKDYTAALSIDPMYALAHFNKGIVYLSIQQYDSAIQTFSKAIEQCPSFAKAYYQRGVTYQSLNKYQEAIISYTEALNLDPDFSTAFYRRGLAHQQLRKYDQALADLSEAAYLDHNNPQIFSKKGLLLLELSQLKQAENDLNIALQISPSNPQHYFNLARCYMLMEEEQNARQCFQGGLAVVNKKGELFFKKKFNYSDEKIQLFHMVNKVYSQNEGRIQQLQGESNKGKSISLRNLRAHILKATCQQNIQYEETISEIRRDINKNAKNIKQIASKEQVSSTLPINSSIRKGRVKSIKNNPQLASQTSSKISQNNSNVRLNHSADDNAAEEKEPKSRICCCTQSCLIY